MLDGNESVKVETTELLQNAERAFGLMGTACEAVKGHRWDEAEEILKRLQSMVHQLRVDVRDERLVSEYRKGRMTQEETVAAELKAAGASFGRSREW